MKNVYDRIFEITDESTFNEVALEVFQYQKRTIPVYKQFVEQLNKPEPKHYSEIPFLKPSKFARRI